MEPFDMKSQPADETTAAPDRITGIIAKLRAKYPELADEPLLDQVEVAAGDAGSAEGSADLETPAETTAEGGQEEPSDALPAEASAAPTGKRKRKLSEMPAPDLGTP